MKQLAFYLIIVGGLNWLLIGLFNFNLVTVIFGDTMFSKLVYVLVGLSALYTLFAGSKK